MGVLSILKMRKAMTLQSKGDVAGAMQLYQQLYEEGSKDIRSLLSYSVLLIRDGQFQKARDLLVKIQKYSMAEPQRTQLFVNYATTVYKLGELQKGIELLERQHQKAPSGIIYQTLGYLYVESGDFEKALAYNQEAYEYDDEDPITLDNLGQTYYRLGNDKEKAKEYFQKAWEIKPSQIDTLYFLAQYDIADGNTTAAKEKLEKALEGKFSPLNYVTRAEVEAAHNAL